MEIITRSHIDERHAASPYFSSAESADGLYSWIAGSPGYVSINCATSGLRDNTMGKRGRHVIYPQYPDPELPAELLAGARAFLAAIHRLQEARQEAEERAAWDAEMATWGAMPAEIRSLFGRYGSSQAAWEAEDERAWALMRRYE